MFFALGLKNAWRNRGRTVLAIVSMCIAAMIFLSSTTLSKGYPSVAFKPARQLLGGDIVLLPDKSAISREDMAGGYTWRFEVRSLDKPNPVMGFDTRPYSYGALQGHPVSGTPEVSGERYREVLSRLETHPTVLQASIRRALPFLTGGVSSYEYGFLDARDIDQGISTWDMLHVGGSPYRPPDEDLVGVSVGGWAGLRPIGRADLEIPRFKETSLDYEDPLQVALTLIGQASFVEGSGPTAVTLSAPAVFVSPATLDRLSQEAGYPEEATYWGISVTLKDMFALENVAALLRREFPDFTVLPVSQLSTAATQGSGVALGVPMDMRRVTETIAFVTAALLSATNLTILMLSRKNEIGILRALGATGWNITCMVLTEAIWISLIGALAGALVTQPAVLWQLLSNNVGRDAVLREVGAGVGKAMAFAALAAAVFGFLPVARALRITPAQVLRGE
ncbi:MAG: ABC transporter permease [Bacillota bacterium]